VQSTLGVQFQNDTGRTIGSLTIGFDCEQWRYGGRTQPASSDSISFQYSVNATSLTDAAATWIDVPNLNCSSTVTGPGTSASTLNGNLAANRTAVFQSISELNIADETTFWLRWRSNNITGSDDGLSIDSFSLSAQSPSVVVFDGLSARAAFSLSTALPVLGLVVAGGLVVWKKSR
jgi:hypothetical protein